MLLTWILFSAYKKGEFIEGALSVKRRIWSWCFFAHLNFLIHLVNLNNLGVPAVCRHPDRCSERHRLWKNGASLKGDEGKKICTRTTRTADETTCRGVGGGRGVLQGGINFFSPARGQGQSRVMGSEPFGCGAYYRITIRYFIFFL